MEEETKPIPISLDEAAEKYASKNFPNKTSWEYYTEYNTFLAGAEWQKNQIAGMIVMTKEEYDTAIDVAISKYLESIYK